MKPVFWKYFLLNGILFFVALQSVSGQHIYVRSNTETVGGWIVNDQGKTFFELPASWRLSKNSGATDLIQDWPVLLEHRPRQDSANYSFLHADGRWELLAKYDRAKVMGKGCYWFGLKDSKKGVFHFGEQELVLPEAVGQSNFTSDGFAIVYIRPINGRTVRGLINTAGEWVIPPQAEVIAPLGQNRWYYQDTLLQNYMLRIVMKSDEAPRVDTILNLSELGWKLQSTLPFDDTGHTWVTVGHQQHMVMDTAGQISSDTISTYLSYLRPFDQGLSWVGNPKRLMDIHGETIFPSSWKHAMNPSEGRILVQDNTSGYFGYLDKNGDWEIPPVYCFASNFRDGLALTSGAFPESCGDQVFERTGTPPMPAFLKRYHRTEYHELLDTTGQIVWADSCREVYLLPGRIIVRNQGPSLLTPAFRIDWLEKGQYWLSPNYHFTDWEQLLAAPTHDVKRIDLGVGKYRFGLAGGNHALPERFPERLATWPDLEALALNFHEMTSAWPQIVQLENLQRLSLSYCNLERIPDDLGSLKQLTHLDLSSNELTSFPKSLYRMRHLQELNVAENPLPPETILRLRKRLPDTKIIYKREW